MDSLELLASDSLFFLIIRAVRSRDKMLSIIKKRISDAEYTLRSAQNSIEQLNKIFEEVKQGDLNKIYI